MKINSSRMTAPLIQGDKFLSQKANRPDWDKKKKRCSSWSNNSLWRQFVSMDNLQRAHSQRGSDTFQHRTPHRQAAHKLWRPCDSSITRMCLWHGSACVGVFNLTHANSWTELRRLRFFFPLKTNACSSMSEDLQAAPAALRRTLHLFRLAAGSPFSRNGTRPTCARSDKLDPVKARRGFEWNDSGFLYFLIVLKWKKKKKQAFLAAAAAAAAKTLELAELCVAWYAEGLQGQRREKTFLWQIKQR